MFSVRTAVVDQLPHLRRYAYFLTGDTAAGDDLVQDCVARAIDRADQFKPGTNFRAWLFTILRSVFLNHQRSLKNQPVSTEERSPPPSLVNGNQETHVELRQVEAALGQLTNEHRDVLLLVVVEGFSYEETARIVEVPVGTVRSRLARARAELHRQLQDSNEQGHTVTEKSTHA